MSDYRPDQFDISGIELAAMELDSGKIVLHQSGKVMDELPKTIEVNGVVYSLEDTKRDGKWIWGQYA